MKKLLLITGLIFCMLANSNKAESAVICLGVYVSINVEICNTVILDNGTTHEECDTYTVSFCRGIWVSFGIAGFQTADDFGPSITITRDVIIKDFEHDDGSITDIIIPAGEVADFDEASGYYITKYYIYEN